MSMLKEDLGVSDVLLCNVNLRDLNDHAPETEAPNTR